MSLLDILTAFSTHFKPMYKYDAAHAKSSNINNSTCCLLTIVLVINLIFLMSVFICLHFGLICFAFIFFFCSLLGR